MRHITKRGNQTSSMNLLLKESKEFIEELLVSAFNSALQKVEKASRQKLSDLTAQIQTKFSDDSTEA